MAQAFDLGRLELTGEAVPIAEGWEPEPHDRFRPR